MKRKQEGMIGVRVDDELRARIEAAAERDRRPLSSFVRVVLQEYLDATESAARAA